MNHKLSKSSVTCEDGTSIEAAVVLDATGHSRRLVKYDKPFNPGYQIAYGIVAEVCNHVTLDYSNWTLYFGDDRCSIHEIPELTRPGLPE